MGANLLFLMNGRILLDEGELEGDELLTTHSLCEPHRPKRYEVLVI